MAKMATAALDHFPFWEGLCSRFGFQGSWKFPEEDFLCPASEPVTFFIQEA